MTPPSAGSADRAHPLFARAYARLSPGMDDGGMRDLRRELLAGLAGTVVEVGAGNGLNFAHYPPAVTRVHAVEPEPHLRAIGERAAAVAPVPVTVHAARGEDLPLPDGSVDAAVLCLVVCSLDDRPRVLAEVRRVLRPGGSVRFLEHTVAGTAGLRAVQRAVDATVWPRLTGGCRTTTDVVALLGAAGFTISALRRFPFPDTWLPQPAQPHVLGTAQVDPAPAGPA